MKRIRVITNFFLTLVFLILASCNGQATEYPQPQKTSTRTPASTPSPRPTYVHPTMQPANATRISKISQERAAKTAIVQNALDDCNGAPDYDWGIVKREYSPAGTWYVAYCRHSDTGVNYTKIINTINDKVWEIPYINIVTEDGFLNDPVEGGQMILKAWSYNEKYAFFIRYFCCVDGPFLMFVDGFGLYRLDLSSGEISEIEKSSAAVSFSSDGRYLARFKPEENAIIVDNLETGKFSSFAIEFDVAGRFSWSPDGNKGVFSATNEDWYQHYLEKGFAVYLIDMNSLALKLLLYRPPNYFTVDRWISDNEVLLVDNSMKSEGEYFILNITTHELTPSNPDGIPLTPTP